MATDLIDGYLAHLRAESASKRTIDERRKILTKLDEELPFGIEEACEDELKTWLWQDGWSPGTRETYHSAMVGLYRWAFEVEELDFDPSAKIKKPKVPRRLPRPVTDDELLRLLSSREPYILWAKLAAYAGLRCVEISRLRREDITRENVRVERGKGDKPRFVPTHPAIWEAVKDLPPGRVTPFDERYISIRSAIYFRRSLKMPGVSLHRCRHWFGTMIQRLYKDLRVTQELMGHADPSATAGYSLVASQDMATAVSMLPMITAPGGGPFDVADGAAREPSALSAR